MRYDGQTGAYLGVFADTPMLRNPFDLKFGDDGHLYVSDTNPAQSAVYRFDGASGAFLGSFAQGVPLRQPVFITFMPQSCDPCDANCDGTVDGFDIEPFISLLTGGPGCSPCVGDANGDGTVDAFDIEPFIECLVGP
jgi:hypothetical protein